MIAKIITITALLLLLFLFYKFKGFRRFCYLTIVAITIAVLFGPPTYVLMEEYKARYPANDKKALVYHFSWRLSPLNPTSAKYARLGLYHPESKKFLPLSAEHTTQVSLPFVVPGNAILLHMWWWIFPAVFLTYWLARKLLPKRTKLNNSKPSMKQAFIHAQQIDTVAAYEQLLQQCQQKRWWKPWRIIKQAQLARDLVFERYKNRLGLLQKINSLAASHAKQHNQPNAKDIARYNGFFDVLRYALTQRQLRSNSQLPIDVRLNKDWFVWTNNTLTATPKISDTERLTLNSLQASWHTNVTDQISLDALRDNYVVNGRSFPTLVKELIKAGSSDRVIDAARDFATYVQHYLVSNHVSAKATADVGNSLVTQYFIYQLFAALNADSQAASYQRGFEEHLPGMLAQIFSLFFPDETLHSTGKPLFSKPQPDSNAACVLNIDLFPTSRRFNGTPSVKGVIYVTFYDETLWSKEAVPAANDAAAKISQDAIARLDATGIVGAAIMPPLTTLKPSQKKAVAALPSRLESLLKELDDAAKELVRSHTEDIALELLAGLLDDKENSLITQFDAVVQSGIEENYALVLQAASELAGFGLGMLAGDD